MAVACVSSFNGVAPQRRFGLRHKELLDNSGLRARRCRNGSAQVLELDVSKGVAMRQVKVQAMEYWCYVTGSRNRSSSDLDSNEL